jgi:hypothetical protein
MSLIAIKKGFPGNSDPRATTIDEAGFGDLTLQRGLWRAIGSLPNVCCLLALRIESHVL